MNSEENSNRFIEKPPRIIEGLLVTVPGQELKALAWKRATYHRDRAVTYRNQAQALADAGIDAPAFATSGNLDPKVGSINKAKEHEQQGDEMDFIAYHIDVTAVYQLDRSDLERLGIVKSRY